MSTTQHATRDTTCNTLHATHHATTTSHADASNNYLGKTTLLDILAGRKKSGKVEGEILVNGKPPGGRLWKRVAGYVMQVCPLLPSCLDAYTRKRKVFLIYEFTLV